MIIVMIEWESYISRWNQNINTQIFNSFSFLIWVVSIFSKGPYDLILPLSIEFMYISCTFTVYTIASIALSWIFFRIIISQIPRFALNALVRQYDEYRFPIFLKFIVDRNPEKPLNFSRLGLTDSHVSFIVECLLNLSSITRIKLNLSGNEVHVQSHGERMNRLE